MRAEFAADAFVCRGRVLKSYRPDLAVSAGGVWRREWDGNRTLGQVDGVTGPDLDFRNPG